MREMLMPVVGGTLAFVWVALLVVFGTWWGLRQHRHRASRELRSKKAMHGLACKILLTLVITGTGVVSGCTIIAVVAELPLIDPADNTRHQMKFVVAAVFFMLVCFRGPVTLYSLWSKAP